VGHQGTELEAEPQAARSEEHDQRALGALAGEQAGAEPDVGQRQQQAARGRDERPPPLGQPAHDLAREPEGRHPRDQREPGDERGPAEALLQVEREREQQGVVGRGGGGDGRGAPGHRRRGDGIQVDEGLGAPALRGDEDRQRGNACHQARPRPGGPAVGVPEHERQHTSSTVADSAATPPRSTRREARSASAGSRRAPATTAARPMGTF
jgi:hypothetical protein